MRPRSLLAARSARSQCPLPQDSTTGMLRVQLMLAGAGQRRPGAGWPGRLVSAKEEVMPAVTVEDILVLPRISEPDNATAQDRPVLAVTTAPSAFEGEGFPVRRAFAGVDLNALDPFIHMDQMGEVDYAPGEPKGTAWHPHRGFETVTYIIDGTFEHN